MANFKDLLDRADVPDEEIIEHLPELLATTLHHLKHSPDIHTRFRGDLLKLIVDTLDAIHLMSQPNYSTEAVTTHLTSAIRLSAGFLAANEQNRPYRNVTGIQHKDTSQLMDVIFHSQQDAENFINSNPIFGDANKQASIVPARLTSLYTTRPSAPKPKILPPALNEEHDDHQQPSPIAKFAPKPATGG